MKTIFENLSAQMQKEFWALLALKQCKHLSPRALRTLLIHYGSGYEIYCQATNKQDLNNFQTKKYKISPNLCQELKSNLWRKEALLEWQSSKKYQGEVILWTDYRYPLGLKQITDAPPYFYAKGDMSLLSSHSVAIVGSRRFHQDTLEQTKHIAKDLSACGICVVSGLAKGIDSAAHYGALEEIGGTIAVLGCGINHIYPPENAKLYQAINEKGLLISEFPMDKKPLAQNFPIRNRLVSGLSEAVLVAEAELKSGSLITARLALEQNRPVYVLEPKHENHSLGCQNLITDGALAITDALAIIADIAPNLENKSSTWSKNKNVAFDFEQNKVVYFNKLNNNEQITKNEIETNQVEKPKLDCSKIKMVEYEVKKMPSFNENQPELDIDFGKLAQSLMGEIKPFSSVDVLRPRPKTSKPKLSKSNKPQAITIIPPQHPANSVKNLQTIPEEVKKQNQTKNFSELEKNILEVLEKNQALVLDEILMHLPKNMQNVSEISTSLLILEMEKYLHRLEGGRYQIETSA